MVSKPERLGNARGEGTGKISVDGSGRNKKISERPKEHAIERKGGEKKRRDMVIDWKDTLLCWLPI
jgi:hypothetical protein